MWNKLAFVYVYPLVNYGHVVWGFEAINTPESGAKVIIFVDWARFKMVCENL